MEERIRKESVVRRHAKRDTKQRGRLQTLTSETIKEQQVFCNFSKIAV